MPTEVFRFMVPRASAPATSNGSLEGVTGTPLGAQLESAWSAGDRPTMEAVARGYLAGSEAVTSTGALSTPIESLVARLEAPGVVTVRAALLGAAEVLKAPPHVWITGDEYQRDLARLRATTVASLVLGHPHAELAHALRVLSLLGQAPSDDDVRGWLSAPLELPPSIFPLPRLRPQRAPTGVGNAAAPEPRVDDLPQLASAALAMIAALPPEAHEIPAAPERRTGERAASAWADRFVRAVRTRLGVDDAPPTAAAPSRPIRFASTARARFSRALADELRARGAALETTDVQSVARALRQIASSAPASSSRRAERMIISGGNVYSGARVGKPNAGGGPVPTGAAMRVVGFADLIRVDSQIRRYEAGEIAHVENVLAGELRRREHRRFDATQELVIVETERTEELERDLESTEKFEMERESTEVQKNESKFEAGLTVSASYGPSISTEANMSYASQQSAQRSARAASRYARAVTETSSSRLRDRAVRRRELRTVRETEEKNLHELNNPAGNGHVVGVYRWLDKVYEMQTVNYGKRLMVDFIVPEPAAFLLHALATNASDSNTINKPIPFNLSADQIDLTNYRQLAATYHATAIKEPPPEYVTVGHVFKFEAAPPRTGLTSAADAAKVDVPAGYRAIYAVGRVNIAFSGEAQNFSIIVGRHSFGYGAALDNEVGSLPVQVAALNFVAASAGVEILCQRTDEAYARWQIETHAEITGAYLKLQDAYEDRLKSEDVAGGISILGRNPAENREIERAELKKHALSILTGQHFDGLGAIADDPTLGYPQPDLARTGIMGALVLFFEQTFEWAQMMYLHYPYYWARKERWLDLALLQDVDPEHAHFLRAGSTRVSVPIRPGFEAAFLHFMETGNITGASDPPSESSPATIDIVTELRSQQGVLAGQIVGEPWEVRVPTTLVWLQGSSLLPTWSADGTPE